MMKDEAALKTFAHDAAIAIYTGSFVWDDWINQLRVYWNIEIPENSLGLLRLYTFSLYCDLLIERISDIVTPIQRVLIQEELANESVQFFDLLDGAGKGDPAIKWMREIQAIISKRCIVDNMTIVQAYTASLVIYFKDLLPEDIIHSYVEQKVEAFEELNLRHRLYNFIDDPWTSSEIEEAS